MRCCAAVLALFLAGCSGHIRDIIPPPGPSGVVPWSQEPVENRQYECSEVLFRAIRIIILEEAFWKNRVYTSKQLTYLVERQILLMNGSGETDAFLKFCEQVPERSQLECAMGAGSQKTIRACMHMDNVISQ